MDGNGRWAKKIGKKREFGHKNGTESVRECINASLKIGDSKI
jgi:undecaprenyl diphosphate synthase